MEDRNVHMVECDKNQDNQEHQKHPKKMGLKHGLLMILCCLIPIALIGLLPLLGVKGLSWSWLFFLLCPIMHIGMMFFMKDHH